MMNFTKYMSIFDKSPFLLIMIGLFWGTSLVFSQNDTPFKVVLDAGHGGKDPGKAVGKIYEKDVVLSIVLEVGRILSSQKDIKVIYTRDKDIAVDLYERGAIANRAKADVFISVHCNSHKTQAHGAETFVLGLHQSEQNFEVAKTENEVIYLEDDYQARYADYNINSPETFIGLSIVQEEFLEQSIQLAKTIQNNFTHKMKRLNRGVKQAGFIVLHQTYMPSVLIETGFVTNTQERTFLTSKKGQQEFAQNIADAIISYKKWIEGKSMRDVYLPITSNELNTNLVYKVQISTSHKKIETKPYNFNKLSPISVEKNGKIYRYAYGNVHRFAEAQKLLAQARKAGYKDAFIVAYYHDKKISVAEAKRKENR